MLLVFVLFILAQNTFCTERGDLVHWYKDGINFIKISGLYNLTACLDACVENNKYRYAIVNNNTQECGCTNYLGKNYNEKPSNETCQNCNIYYTGIFAPTPPKQLSIENVTETSAYISWEKPDFFIDIQNYQVKVKVIKTYATFIVSPQWSTFANNTYDAELDSLNPGTRYNITVQAISSFAEGENASAILETIIGDPDIVPLLPETVKREGSKMVVTLNPVKNNNGPVTSYYVVVLNQDKKQFFQPDFLKSFKESKQEDVGYYIAAEIEPNRTDDNFVVGDGNNYGKFYNAPLDANTNYVVIEGVVSKSGNITKVVYSNIGTHEKNKEIIETGTKSSSALFTALTVCIFFLTIVLSVVIVFYIYIRQKAFKNRLRRIRNNQELAMQGPILEVVNEGYIPEDEIHPVDHYNALKQKIWRIPQNLVKIDHNNVLGVGQFGSVHSGTIKKNDDILVIIFVINDKKLSNDNKRNMLRDFDLLIKSDKHSNVVELLGICESSDTLYVVLEAAPTNLKDLLLGSRDTANGRFSSITESQAVSFMVNIANGIKHLQKQRILHKQLCARNIQITDNQVAKVSGYGLAQYNHRNMMPDYTRWMAVEIFNNLSYTHKSSAWSFACIMWEISVLGGTPYGSIPNNEIPERIKKGLRLMQLSYITDELYQLMLDCWQVDPDERPSFYSILDTLVNYQTNQLPLLNFNLFPGFQYEQFYIDSESVARTSIL